MIDTFTGIYYIIWSVVAIGGGVLLLFFREKYIKLIERGFRNWYNKTGFFLFKLQAENTDSAYMRMVTVIVAIVFIAVGIITLIQNI